MAQSPAGSTWEARRDNPVGGSGEIIVFRNRGATGFGLFLMVSGCAPNLPVEQVQRANAAYDAVAASSQPLLAELAAAERHTNLIKLTRDTPPALHDGDIVIPVIFDPKSAALFSTSGDPELTTLVRRGLRVIGDYFRLLSDLAEGKNIDEVKARIKVLAISVAGLGTALTGAAAGPVVNKVLDGLTPLIGQWMAARNAEELRRLVLEGEPLVRDEIAALQAASRTMYENLTRDPIRSLRTTLADGPPEARHAVYLHLADITTSLSNYVILLGKLDETLSALADAVRSPGSPLALSVLSASADNLQVQARAAADAMTLIKAGRPQ